MPDQIVVSNSSIQTFKQCRRKFWLEHYRKLRPKRTETTGALALGSRVHKALELYYGELGRGLTSEDADLPGIWAQLCEDDRMLLMEEFLDTEKFDAEAELGRIMLEGYVQWIEDEGIDSELEIISQEETLDAEFFEGRVKVVGKIDQRVRRKADGARLIRDFKTSANFADLHKTIQMNEQFILYMVLEMLKKDEKDRVAGAIVTALKKNKRTATAKPPFYDQMEVMHNIFELRNFYMRLQGELQQIIQFWDRLDAGEDHQVVAYPSPSRDCSWRCPFSDICPMFDDGSDVERALSDQFESRSPFEYYGDSDPLASTS